MRRRRRRRIVLSFFAGIAVCLLGVLIFVLWQPFARVTQVSITGYDASATPLAQQALAGAYYGIVPRNTIFAPDKGRIRSVLLAHNPNVAAVSFSRKGINRLAVSVDPRTPLARWCGPRPGTIKTKCYIFDPSGFVFATTTVPALAYATTSSTSVNALFAAHASSTLASSTQADAAPAMVTQDPYVLFEPLAATTSSPIGTTLPHASNLPKVFAFAHALSNLGGMVATISIEGSTVQDLLTSGTEVEYEVGQESQALSALNAARVYINLSNGSTTLVDLRFAGKIYLKKASTTHG